MVVSFVHRTYSMQLSYLGKLLSKPENQELADFSVLPSYDVKCKTVAVFYLLIDYNPVDYRISAL